MEESPLWALRAEHVQIVLQVILDYWSDYWGVPRIVVPDPQPKGYTDAKADQDRRQILRKEQLEPCRIYAEQVRSILNTDQRSELPERRLFAAILSRAIFDWIAWSLSVRHAEQRRAAETYWWIMDLPPLFPLRLKEPDWILLEKGKLRDYKLDKDSNPFDILAFRRARLWDVDNYRRPRNVLQGITKFQSCCHIVDVDPKVLRTHLHLLTG